MATATNNANTQIQIVGQIDSIFEKQAIGNFTKRQFWVKEVDIQKPQCWELEMQFANCDLLDNYKAGQMVMCNVDVRGRMNVKNNQSRVFNSLVCIKIQKIN